MAGLFLLLGFIGLIFYAVSTMMKSSGAYQMALHKARENPQVVSALGEPIAEGLFTSGNINESGSSGSADLAIPISGPKGKATIYLVASESAGKWTFSNLLVEIKKTQSRIDLLQEQKTLDQ
ncbi:MAG: cytochrome c oxidase assembly factor Coa1 family protein [Arenimonas sp.]